MAVMVRFAVPVFLSATVFVLLLVSIACVGNVRLVGDRATIGAEVEVVLLVNFSSCDSLIKLGMRDQSPSRRRSIKGTELLWIALAGLCITGAGLTRVAVPSSTKL